MIRHNLDKLASQTTALQFASPAGPVTFQTQKLGKFGENAQSTKPNYASTCLSVCFFMGLANAPRRAQWSHQATLPCSRKDALTSVVSKVRNFSNKKIVGNLENMPNLQNSCGAVTAPPERPPCALAPAAYSAPRPQSPTITGAPAPSRRETGRVGTRWGRCTTKEPHQNDGGFCCCVARSLPGGKQPQTWRHTHHHAAQYDASRGRSAM